VRQELCTSTKILIDCLLLTRSTQPCITKAGDPMIKFHVDGDLGKDLRRLSRRGDNAIRDLNDRSKPLNKIKQKQITRWSHNFAKQGTEYGSRWDDLSPATIQSRERPSAPMLVQTGSLFQHFTKLNKGGVVSDTNVKWIMTNAEGEHGGAANILYHHFGGENHGWYFGSLSDVPARPMWDMDEQDAESAKEELAKWMDGILLKYFGIA
jgi:hypothetical protein